MHLPQTRVSQVLAASLSVALLAGCPNAGTAPSINASVAPGATASAGTTTPSGTASTTPASSTAPIPSNGTGNATTAPAASSAVATSNPAPTGATTILQGKVYNEAGAIVDGANLSLRSLDKRQPFTATATTAGGNYVVNNVPVGVQVEVTVTKDGWTRRSRVTSLQSDVSTKNILDFGTSGATNNEDPAGEAFFISDSPEIASATPGASPIKGDKLSYTIRFSEALDDDNRDLVEDSFSLDTTAVEAALVPSTIVGAELSASIVIEKGSSFLSHKRKLTFTWSQDNTTLTVDFDAPLRTLDDDDKSYRFRLIRRAGDAVIDDASGKILGFAAPTAGESYTAVKKASLTLAAGTTTAAARWTDTHQGSSSFDVAEDNVDPTLVSIEANKENVVSRSNAEYLRVDMTFSEPMRVYPDEKGYARSVVSVDNFIFAFGKDAGDLEGVDMEDAPTSHDTEPNVRLADSTLEKPIKFAAASGATNNDVYLEPSDDDPRIVTAYIPTSALANSGNLKEVKVMVKTDVLDPAGNKVSDKNVDLAKRTADNVAIGSI